MGSLKFKGDSKPSSSRKRKRRRVNDSQEPASAEEGRLSPINVAAVDEELTPPRKGFAKSKYSYEYNLCDGFDFEEARERDFQDRLQDELQAETQEYMPSQDDVYIPPRWRNQPLSGSSHQARNGVTSAQSTNENGAVLTEIILPIDQSLDDEGYAEYVRAGMFKRTHKDAMRIAEEMAREEAEREKRRAEEREKARKLEQERVRRLEEQKSAADAARHRSARETYGTLWKKLLDSSNSNVPLTFDDFPWPFPAHSPSMAKADIRTFLTLHIAPEDVKGQKQALRAAVLAYHPDRFSRFVERVSEVKGERQRIREMGLRISQTLNELLAER